MSLPRAWCLLVVACLLLPLPSAEGADIMKGALIDVSGDVEVNKRGSTDFIKASDGMIVTPGDQISTGIDGKATIKFENSQTVIEPLTQFVVGRTVEGDKEFYTELFLQVGKVTAKVDKESGKTNKFSITTPTAVAGVRGTQFECGYFPGIGCEIKTFEGQVDRAPVIASQLPPAVQAVLGLAPPKAVEAPKAAEAAAKTAELKKVEAEKVKKVEEVGKAVAKLAGDAAKGGPMTAAVATKMGDDMAKAASKEAGLTGAE
ncbi:MAG: hypothetical protein A3I06_14800, partial [Candidatus Lindowbacteria bacterium RIFCSPLOWO2_02_FULL_62_12]